MSYSFTVPAKPKAEIHDAVVEAGVASLANLNHGDEDEAFKAAMTEHIDKIADVVGDLLHVLGRTEDSVHVTISGHANPDHAPHSGWANECMSIYLSVEPA